MLLRASQVLVEDRVLPGGWVRVEGDRIAEVGSGEPPAPPDHEGPWLVPGYVDTHAHGGGGAPSTEVPRRYDGPGTRTSRRDHHESWRAWCPHR